MARAILPSRAAVTFRVEDLRVWADKLSLSGETDNAALLHELLDGYKSPARVDTEIRELKEEIRDLEKDVGELDDRIARARRGRAEALTMLERVRKVCADEVQLDKAIALLQDLDLEN